MTNRTIACISLGLALLALGGCACPPYISPSLEVRLVDQGSQSAIDGATVFALTDIQGRGGTPQSIGGGAYRYLTLFNGIEFLLTVTHPNYQSHQQRYRATAVRNSSCDTDLQVIRVELRHQ